MSEFQRKLAEKTETKHMRIEVEEYDRMKKEIEVRKNKLGEFSHEILHLQALVKAADAIIQPAIEILPDTYEVEVEAYLYLKNKT